MEDSLGREVQEFERDEWDCLNPCCNGRQSRTYAYDRLYWDANYSLNPCCNGRQSRTDLMEEMEKVLKYCLNPCCNGRQSRTMQNIKTTVHAEKS